MRLVSDDRDLREHLNEYMGRFKEWLELIDQRILQGSEANFSLFNSAIKLIGMTLDI